MIWSIERIGLIIVIVLTAFFVVSFFFGRSLNFKRQRNIYKFVAQEIKPYFKKVMYRTYGPDAFSLVFPVDEKKDSPFKKLEATVLLMDRENIVHYLYSKTKGDCDKLTIKADLNLKRKHKFHLEMVSKNSVFFEKAKKAHPDLKEIKIKNITKDFLIKTSDPQVAKNLLHQLPGMNIFNEIKSHILRLSISPDKPHLLLVYSLKEPVSGVFRFLWNYGKIINETLSKSAFAKK